MTQPVELNTPARRRERLRDSLWPDAAEIAWSRKTNKGFTSIPRVLPLIMSLQAELSNGGDPGTVYLDLWCRAFDEGMVLVTDDETFAFSAGYTGNRAVRTWRERIEVLRNLGFIRVREFGNREIGHVLIVNPFLVCRDLRQANKISDAWWNAFLARASEIGATVYV